MNKPLGFTLIETLLVIVIVSIVAGVAGLFMYEGAVGYIKGKPIVNVATKGNINVENLLRELQDARSLSSVGASSITFINQNNETIVVTKTGSNVTRSVNGGTAQTFCTNVSTLTLAYFDSSLATTAVAANVRFVTVNMTLSEDTISYSFIGGTVIRKLL